MHIPSKPVTWEETTADMPWRENLVCWLNPPPDLFARLQGVLDQAGDEKPLQQFLAENPVALALLLGGGHGRWVWPKPRLGAEYVPDFLLCEKHSGGYEWHLVELESPRAVAMIKSGRQSSTLTQAKQQIADWRIWLKKDVAYAQGRLGFTGLDGEFSAVIVIGRRVERVGLEQERYRALSDTRITVMSYDRLVETVKFRGPLGEWLKSDAKRWTPPHPGH